MKLIALSCMGISALEVALASPLSSLARRATVPTRDEVLAGVLVAQDIAVAVAEASSGNSVDVVDGVNLAFNSIYGIVDGSAPGAEVPPAHVDRISLLPPIDRIICMILQCDRGGVSAISAINDAATPQTSLLPPLLDPASALDEIRGWAEGSIPIGPTVNPETLNYEIPHNVATDFANAIAGLVEVWQEESWASNSSFSTTPQRMAIRAVSTDVLTKRNPALIAVLVHVAYLLYTL